MAEVYPEDRANVPLEVEQLVEFCARLPGDWKVFVGWPEIGQETPDILVVTTADQVALLSASGVSAGILDAWTPESRPTEAQGLPLRRLDRAIRSLGRAAAFGVPRLLILTRIKATQLSALFTSLLPVGMACHCIDGLSSYDLAASIRQSSPQPELVLRLRAWIGRPALVQATLTAVPGAEGRSYRFLDRYQEQWLRRYLSPPADAQLANDTTASGHLITGVAGCGKSLLLLYRATLERKITPELRILFVTHNRPLTSELQRRARVVAEQLGVQSLEVWSFFQWCHQWVKPWPTNIVQYAKRDQLIRESLPAPASEAALHFHGEEFAWIAGEGITDLDAYLSVPRHGRIRPIQAADRRRIWSAYVHYGQLLATRTPVGQVGTDWPSLPSYALQWAKRHGAPCYDLILVDEAQFFSPMAMRVLREVLAPAGRMVFAADPTQGFLQRRSPWAATGFDFRGRSTRLQQPYRCTKEILEFARGFYLSRVGEEGGDLNLPTAEDLIRAESGVRPEVVEVARFQDESSVAVELISQLIASRINPHEILVIHHPRAPLLVPANVSWSLVKARDEHTESGVRSCTFDSGTGLEAPYVVVLGLRLLFEAEASPVYAEDRQQLVVDNTGKAYVAFTRAGHRLLVLWSSQGMPAVFQEYKR